MAKGRPRAGLFAGSAVPVTRGACALQPHPQQTVDGLQAALEIGARSSYVPSAPTLAFDPRFLPGDARPNTARTTRLERLLWMK
jgi:hypothetical protein